VLERACWRLRADELGPPGDADADFARVQEWRRARRVPRFVVLAHPGLGLPVDLDNVLSVDSLAHAVRNAGGGDLVELFPAPDALCARGPEGRFTHELVVPFVRDRAPAPPESRRPSPTVRRVFPPGSEWLYVRLYTGETTADALLTDELAPLRRELAEAGLVDRWHFLRYRDPGFHLRVRFHGEAARVRTDVLPRIELLGADLVDRGLVWRVELGTYDREVGHYGGPEAIGPAEDAFHADSDAVVSILSLLGRGQADQEERWQLGLFGVHALLLDLGLDPSERLALARHYRANGARVLGWGDAVFVGTGRRFRQEREALEQLLDPDALEPGPLEPGLRLLRARSEALAPVALELRRLASEDRLTTTIPRIAGNLMHMHLNRLLRGNNLAQEAVICDFLARLYESSIRRVERPRVRAR
jgi:thiopeptide-type bacteriocin biosynthesis protein